MGSRLGRGAMGATVVAMAALVGCTSDGGPSTGDATAAGTSTAPGGGDQWPAYGHDHANTRTNVADTAIDATSVHRLEPDWRADGLVGVTGTPVVTDRVAYFGDWTGSVRAVDAETGDEHWATPIGAPVVGAPAVDGDAVFASSGATLVRLDRASGTPVWTVRTDDHPQAQINASPVVVDGLVLQGTASFENILLKDTYTFRGSIAAYDAATGEERWKFLTTAADEDEGPGAGVWSTPAIDPERGLLYVGTGQTLAEPTAPLTDSLLAIDYRTGELAWSRQFTYPDVFSAGHPTGKDADVGASPNLWTSGGRDLVGAGDKGGTFHALDRDTGEIVWETELTPGSAFGGQIGSAAFVDGLLVASSNVGDPETNAPTDRTRIFGIDPATGDITWTAEEQPGKIFAPVSAVSGLAFVGTDQGRMLALDTATGEIVWTFEAPTRTACGPSVVDGRLLWGYGFMLFDGPGDGGLISFTVGT